MATARDWRTVAAPTLADFEHLAAWAWDRLPGHFRELCRDLVIRVEDFASDEALAELDIEDAFDLMGLYRGVSLTRRNVSDPPREPDMVYLYRRPILDYWADGDDSLGELITHVLVHEIGHHFGFSDADMEDIEGEVAD